MRNKIYVYKERDLTTEDMYQNKRLMGFNSNLGYFGRDSPMDKVSRKRLQCVIDIQLLATIVPEKKGKLFLVSS